MIRIFELNILEPKKPEQVVGTKVTDPKTIEVTWQQPLPRPGITTYSVKVYEASDDGNSFKPKPEFGKNISGEFLLNFKVELTITFLEFQIEVL